MMKTYFSFLLFFAFLFISAQKISDKDALKKCKKEFNKKTCLSDKDGDGILYYLDQCPNEEGYLENNGCPWPDSDGDGLVDKDDACPTFAGTFENNGCPWPDTDGDGILDKDDACPTVAGIPEKDGCPGRNGKNCSLIYEESKLRYEKGLAQLQITDFTTFFDELFKNDEFLKIKTDKRKIVFLGLSKERQGPECGNDPYYDCPRFEKDIKSEVFDKLWTRDNFNKFQKNLKEKYIIPVNDLYISTMFKGGEIYFSTFKINSIYKGTIVNTEKKESAFYYSSYLKPKNQLIIHQKNETDVIEDYLKLVIEITPAEHKDFENVYFIQLISVNDEETFVSKDYFYQFIEGKWKFIKER